MVAVPEFDLTRLRGAFRDDAQRSAVMWVLHDRLTDDRQEQECRYLLKLMSQLNASYTEVTAEQLEQHLSAVKLQVVQDLIEAAASSPEHLDGWIIRTEAAFPLVEDRGYARHLRRLRLLRFKGWLRDAWRFIWRGL